MANKRTAAIEAGFDYQYFWFWDYAIRMLPHNSNIKSVEFESCDASPFDDIVINYWDNISCSSPINYCNRDFLQCKFKVKQEESLKWNDLLSPNYYGNKESLFVRAYKFYKNEVQKDRNFRLILCTSIDFENNDLLKKFISSYERELDVDSLFKSAETYDLRIEIKKHITQNIADTKGVSDEEIKIFLSHFRFYTAEWFDKVVSNFKFNCDKAKVDYDRSKLSEPFTSLIKKLNRNGRTIFKRQDIVDLCKNDKLITNDLDYIIYDSDYFKLKEQWHKLKIQWEKDKNNIDTYNNYAPIAEQYDLVQKQKEATISQFRSLIKIINIDGLTIPQNKAVRLAKEGQWEEFAIVCKSEIQKEILEKSKEEKNALNALVDNLKSGWENRLNVLRVNIIFANSSIKDKAGFETVTQLYLEAVQYAKEYDLSKDVIFDYAKFLRQIHQNENALKSVEEYLSYKSDKQLPSLIRLEALSFVQLLFAKLEKRYKKTLNFWAEAINGWNKFIKAKRGISETFDKEVFLKFQEFLRNSGDFILSNKHYSGEEDRLYGDGGVQKLFLQLHELCESTMKQYGISLSMPDNIDNEYKQYRIGLISDAEQHRHAFLESIVSLTVPDNVDNECKEQYIQDKIHEAKAKNDVIVTMNATTPYRQAEELFAHAYSISKALVNENPNDENCLLQFAENNEAIALNICTEPLTALEILANTHEIYERLSKDGNTNRLLSFALCKQNMAQALMSQDIRTKKEINKEHIEKLHNEATKIMEELYALNPQVYYVNLAQAYRIESDHYRQYGNMREYDKSEGWFLIKLIELITKHQIIDGDINTAYLFVDSLNRYIKISNCFTDKKTYLKHSYLNFKELIKQCEEFSKKYPATFRVQLYEAYMDYSSFLMFKKGEVAQGIKQLEKGCDVFIDMIKKDDPNAFSAADALFSILFIEKSDFYRKKVLKQYIPQIRQIEKDILSKILIFYQSDIPAILLIPTNQRYRQSIFSEQSERERKFCKIFNTIPYRAFFRLRELMQNIGDLNGFLPIANNILKLYLELLNQGHSGYEKGEAFRQIKATTENPHVIIQQNHLSHQILVREFHSIREMLSQIKGGEIVSVMACIDDISKFFEDYKRQTAEGWNLRKDYEKHIADKCNYLVHTIGQIYVEADSPEIEVLFSTAFKLQEQLSKINSNSFKPIMIEYFRYKMLKYMQLKPVDDNTKLVLWEAVLEYLSICEKCKIYNDWLKEFLKSLKVLADEDSDNIEEISDAVNIAKTVTKDMITSLENQHL